MDFSEIVEIKEAFLGEKIMIVIFLKRKSQQYPLILQRIRISILCFTPWQPLDNVMAAPRLPEFVGKGWRLAQGSGVNFYAKKLFQEIFVDCCHFQKCIKVNFF